MPYKRTYKRKTVRAKKAAPVSKKIKSYVKTTLARVSELKTGAASSLSNFYWTTYNTTSGTAGQTISLCDSLDLITQGAGQGDRIGNQITLKKLIVKFIFSPTPSTVTIDTNIYKTIKLMLFRVKKQMGPPTTTQWNQLLQNGNADTAPSNQYLDIMRPFNKDLFEIKKTYTFRLNKMTDAEVQTQMNGHSFIKTISLDISKYLPKKIMYDDTTAQPTNARLFAGVLIADSKGQPIPAGLNEFKVQCSYLSHAEYTDN